MRTIGNWLQRLIEMLMALMLAVMVVAVFVNVALRYLAGTGIASSEELSRLLFVWLVCLGAILASAEHRHLGFELVQTRLSARGRQVSAWITRALMVYPLWLLIEGSLEQVKVGVGIFSPVMGYPLALAAAAVLVMAVAMLVLLAVDAMRALAGGERETAEGGLRP